MAYSALTKPDIAALKCADRVSFHRNAEGRAWLWLTKNPDTDRNPLAQETTHEIECAYSAVFYDKLGRGTAGRDNDWTGFDMIHSCRYSDEWQTVLALVRIGDTLNLHWQRGAWNSDNLEQNGMVGDVLTIQILRDDGRKKLSFLVGHYIGPDHSTARMVRVAPRIASAA